MRPLDTLFILLFPPIFRARNHPYTHSAKSALLNKRDPRLFPRQILKGPGGRVNEAMLEIPMLEKMSKSPPMGTMITPPTSPVILSGVPGNARASPDISNANILNLPNPVRTKKPPSDVNIINKDCNQCAGYRSKIDDLESKSDEIKNAIKTVNLDIDQFEKKSNEKFEKEMAKLNENSVETSDDDEKIAKLTDEIVERDRAIENIDLVSENKKLKQETENLKKELSNMKFNAQLELQIKSQHIKDLEDSKSQKENKRLKQENEELKNELSNLKSNSEKEIQKKSFRINELEGEDQKEIQRLKLEIENLKKELSNLKSNDQIKSKYIKELEDTNR